METQMTRTDPMPARLSPKDRPFAPAWRDAETLLAGLSSVMPLGVLEALMDRLEGRS
jgi:hypothetical protein